MTDLIARQYSFAIDSSFKSTHYSCMGKDEATGSGSFRESGGTTLVGNVSK